jgi:hypothetical protein
LILHIHDDGKYANFIQVASRLRAIEKAVNVCAYRFSASADGAQVCMINHCGGTNMQTELMFLTIYNKLRLSLREVCEAIGMSLKTA